MQLLYFSYQVPETCFVLNTTYIKPCLHNLLHRNIAKLGDAFQNIFFFGSILIIARGGNIYRIINFVNPVGAACFA